MDMIWEQSLLVNRRSQVEAVRELDRILRGVLREKAIRWLEQQLEREADRYLGRKPYQRHHRRSGVQVQARCCKCGSSHRRNMLRHGHRRRTLLTLWGNLTLWVPRVVCRCGGSVRIPSRILRPGQRIWEDVTLRIQHLGERTISLRETREDLADGLGTVLGLRTLNERLQAVSNRKPGAMDLTTVPPVIMLDGIWATLLLPTGRMQVDKRGRQRPVKKKVKAVILIALGIWPQTATIRVVDWEVTSSERGEDWEKLLQRLKDRQLWPERGLKLFLHDGGGGLIAALRKWYWEVPSQRCVFHKLQNVWRAIQTIEEQPADEKRQLKKGLIQQAAAIFRARDERTARGLFAEFAQQWQETQPKAVETLRRDLDDTLRFYKYLERNPSWKPEAIRTISRLERLNRTLRKALRAAGAHHSWAGLEAMTLRVLWPLVVV